MVTLVPPPMLPARGVIESTIAEGPATASWKEASSSHAVACAAGISARGVTEKKTRLRRVDGLDSTWCIPVKDWERRGGGGEGGARVCATRV